MQAASPAAEVICSRTLIAMVTPLLMTTISHTSTGESGSEQLDLRRAHCCSVNKILLPISNKDD